MHLPADSPDVAASARYEYAQIHMGMRTRLVVYAPDEAKAASACTAAFARIAQLEDIMSDYRRESELMRLCRRAGQGPTPVSLELFFVLSRAVELSERSGGAFDISAVPYVNLWREARACGRLPSLGELAAVRPLADWRNIRLDRARRTVELTEPGMRLDLGAIGKGYAGDCAIAVLKQHGVRSALFESGGDIVISAAPPGTGGWTISLSHPADGVPERVCLADAAISTSGDTEQFLIVDGRRFSHVIDPRTGMALTDRWMVTVVAPDGITADSLSTAAAVLGPEAGMALVAQAPGCTAYIRRVAED